MPDLDRQLAMARQDLLAEIRAAELPEIKARARVIRQRRLMAGAVAALVLLTGTGVAWTGRSWLAAPPAEVGASPTRTALAGLQWRGAGLTVLGLNGDVLDVPGEVREVEFADHLLGYALAADCRDDGGERCTTTVAVTEDAGRTWAVPGWLASPSARVPRDRLPSLLALGPRALLVGPDGSWISDRTSGFVRTGTREATAEVIPAGARPWVNGGAGDRCDPGPVRVWLPDGWLVRLAAQPAMQVCRVAAAPSASGAWWVAGRAGGRPAVGVSRDAGRSWRVTALPAPDPAAWAEVSTLGADVFATVVTRRGGDPYPQTRTVHGVYRSAGGSAFSSYVAAGATVIGDVVPLLDGGLLAAGPGWQVSAGAGGAFTPAGGSLPWVYRMHRTPAAWVAYDLFHEDWTAISRDGVTWQKINLR